MSILSDLELRLGLGTLRLTTDGRPDPLESQNLILFALNHGIRIIDTADSYCRNQDDFHFGEHLVYQAIRKWAGDRDSVRILTKVGFVRPNGKWIPCGTATHIIDSVHASLKAFGVERLFLLQLHARDPQLPFEDTLAVLARLQAEGKVEHLGLCNVSLAEIEQARHVIDIASIQNELSVLNTQSANLGVLRFCQQNDIPFLAHRPLGGHAHTNRLKSLPVLPPLAERHHATTHEIALASLLDVSPNIVPLFGATRLESVKSAIRAAGISLDISDRMAISLQCNFEAAVSGTTGLSTSTTNSRIEDAGPVDSPEIVVIMGIQGAGKSQLVEKYLASGYARLNRDEIGGTLDGLVPRLQQLIAQGHLQVVLDNTYATQLSRLGVLQTAADNGLPVRCVFLNTPLHDANINIAQRMIARYGMPLGPDEMKLFRKVDPTLPPPQALTRWAASFEPPTTAEGFASVVEVPFIRRTNADYKTKGLLLDVDGTLRRTLSGEVYPRTASDVAILPDRTETLQRWLAADYKLFFVSNQSGIATGSVSHDAVQAAMLRTAELLNVPITEVVYCSHPAKPLGCFCRKPLPGLGVYLIERYQLAIDTLVMVGDRDTDAQFAAGLGIQYYDETEFFSAVGPSPNHGL